jgi:transposase
VIQLDNGRFHYAKNLTIPDNIVLLFQPPYSPDVNPIERVWQFMKDKLRWINLKIWMNCAKKLMNNPAASCGVSDYWS